ncbi:Tetracenomycin polyketide synthesis O-methyltransferase TcmP 2 [Colletotrichum chlorophyti]|uniref:Tetracenomycin polyketide synthesis O-methyltransferase TcmP 2 n=1 Tax=Colletotrichum chlorophyti TaxID=708187 RepID=A0A1Q8S223_9PEZI|nr:Tetracenomycin polyketide synthesis O-methyltransferase TcmP 2 [Colletotrichum chlorophyti]
MSLPAPSAVPEKGKITLTGAEETLLITLFARAKDAESASPILNDRHTLEVVARIRDQGYDFSRTNLEQSNTTFARLVATRARVLDICCEEFLERNPGPATVIHLACGMDARCHRIKWQGKGRLWIDADLKESTKLRRQVMDDPNAGEGEYRLLDPNIHDDAWLKDYNIPADRPVFVIFEGLTPYLTREELQGILRRIVEHVREGGVRGEACFDAPGSIAYFLINYVFNKALTEMGTRFSWYMDDPMTLEREVPGLKFKGRVFNLQDYARLGHSTWLFSLLARIADWFNVVGRLGSGYRYEF